METTLNNKLIAEFLGYSQPHPDFPYSTYWYKEGKNPLVLLSFDTDWNWLMEVIKEILTISLELDTMELYYDITDNIPNIEEAYKSILEFINWFNKD